MQKCHVAWWQIAILIPVMIVLLLVVRMAHFPGVSEQVADEGIVLATFGGMFIWTRVNAGPLDEYYREQDGAGSVGWIAVEESGGKDSRIERPQRDPVRQSSAVNPARRTN